MNVLLQSRQVARDPLDVDVPVQAFLAEGAAATGAVGDLVPARCSHQKVVISLLPCRLNVRASEHHCNVQVPFSIEGMSDRSGQYSLFIFARGTVPCISKAD